MLGLGGLALPDLLRLRAPRAAAAADRARSVILFWLSGGPGHMETWDPKPDAAERVPRALRRDPARASRACSSASCCPSRRG